MQEIKTLIESAFENRTTLTPKTASTEIKNAVNYVVELLDSGKARIAEKIAGEWQIHQWLKKAVLLYFRLHDNELIRGGFTNYFDKIPMKFNEDSVQSSGVRVVPPAIARKGAYIGANTVLMPSYVNIGAYIDTGTMIDTWATVGSCAQIGKNVHLSGGVGIGGVLEPLQANPTIIEDNCFIGARSEVVEGVIIEEGAVLAMGVFISQSTPIYNRQTKKINYGKVPAGSVVIPGSLPAKDGSHSLAAAIIVKQVDEKTKQKIGINNLLREAVVE